MERRNADGVRENVKSGLVSFSVSVYHSVVVPQISRHSPCHISGFHSCEELSVNDARARSQRHRRAREQEQSLHRSPFRARVLLDTHKPTCDCDGDCDGHLTTSATTTVMAPTMAAMAAVMATRRR